MFLFSLDKSFLTGMYDDPSRLSKRSPSLEMLRYFLGDMTMHAGVKHITPYYQRVLLIDLTQMSFFFFHTVLHLSPPERTITENIALKLTLDLQILSHIIPSLFSE